MKQAKKLTLEQKKIVTNNNLYAPHYMYVSESDFYMKIQRKSDGKVITVDKYRLPQKKKS